MSPAAAKTQTPESLIAAVDAARREDVAGLHALIRRTLPQLEPFAAGKFLGYGRVHYRYASGREGDTFRIGLSANKNYLSLYVCAADARGYVPERYRERLPGADIGKSCVRFKRLAQLDEAALVAMLKEAAVTGYPGEEGGASAAPVAKKPAAKKAGTKRAAATKAAARKVAARKVAARKVAAKKR